MTRGKTATNGSRRVDNLILLHELSPLTRAEGRFANSLFVDPGCGFEARAMLEGAARFRYPNPSLPILGVQMDQARVEAALSYADEKSFFRLEGFNLP